MNRWCRNTILVFSIILTGMGVESVIMGAESTILNAQSTSRELAKKRNTARLTKFSSPSFLAKYKNICQDLQETYKQVYGFETQNFYISICQANRSFLYYRQSKTDANDRILIPAKPVFGGDVFQAVNGKITYFVGVEERGYYSSVMYNNNEIVFEPEIPSTVGELTQNRTVPSEFSQQRANTSEFEVEEGLVAYPEGENRDRICTQDKTDLHPSFQGWQEFIGQSPQVVGEYAIDNGHDFVYDTATPTQAFVETADGSIVNLNIATFSETVERICVNPVAGN